MTDLSALIARHLPAPGFFDTPMDGVQLFRVDAPLSRVSTVYPPSLCVILQGTKRVYLNGRTYVYEAGQALFVAMSIPVEAEILAATPEAPVLGLMLSLESRVAAETIVACQAARTSNAPVASAAGADSLSGLGVARWDPAFTEALRRMLDLLGHPEAVRVLGPGRVREVVYAAIQGEAGARIRSHLGGGQEMARIVGYVRDHLHEAISVDDLARRAGMSRAVFDRRFKAATTYAPLQFIKAMRLNNAALLLRQGATVSEAAYAVGYASASQFSREFSRQFNLPPRAWGRAHERESVGSPSVPFISGPTTVAP
ncbi:AraC family transcriptional regulator [Thalassoroseus pseudoceratinae]|uniref:AraC family transcriptional regulator n=1 Tax=Thalassoroseus pseudoceratinae TaxID=2713176 RepID=UPI00141EDAB7|nr:AraC family transcriptional regulator [Thalassoroseus pseudoceratinae]